MVSLVINVVVSIVQLLVDSITNPITVQYVVDIKSVHIPCTCMRKTT